MANHRTCQFSPFPTSCAPFKFHDGINFVTLQQRWSCLIYESARKKWNKCCQKLPYHKCTETPSLISHSSLSLSHSFFLYRTHTVSLPLSFLQLRQTEHWQMQPWGAHQSIQALPGVLSASLQVQEAGRKALLHRAGCSRRGVDVGVFRRRDNMLNNARQLRTTLKTTTNYANLFCTFPFFVYRIEQLFFYYIHFFVKKN